MGTSFNKRTSDAYHSHKKRARNAGQALDYDPAALRAVVEASLGGPCRYCGTTLTLLNFSCDHATPTSRGGSFCLWNVEITCKPCNEAKGPLTAEEFALLWAALREMTSEGRVNVIRRLRAGGRAISRN